eukprot:5313835-Pleurochrysis_carterae.AAC.6
MQQTILGRDLHPPDKSGGRERVSCSCGKECCACSQNDLQQSAKSRHAYVHWLPVRLVGRGEDMQLNQTFAPRRLAAVVSIQTRVV